MNVFQQTEYIVLRLVRRFLVTPRLLHRFGGILPHYRQNVGEVDPTVIPGEYQRLATECGIEFGGRTVLELGVGVTNGSCYALAALVNEGKVFGFEPFAPLDRLADQASLERVASSTGRPAEELSGAVERIAEMREVGDLRPEIVLSYSVLEHVGDIKGLFGLLASSCSSNVVMIHVVDYRDHFFKYPYAFLGYSDQTWNRWLNPGDLPRWRVSDHIEAAEGAGFDVRLHRQQSLPDDFEKIKERIDRRFASNDPKTAVTQAVLVMRRRGEESVWTR